MKPSYYWVVPVAVCWPVAALGVTFVRFGGLPGGGEQVAAAVLGFLLVGILSGFVLASMLRRSTSRWGRLFGVVGYTLAAPFGYILGIVGPLGLEAFDGTHLSSGVYYFALVPLAIGLYGSLPPVCGAAVGSLLGRIAGRGS